MSKDFSSISNKIKGKMKTPKAININVPEKITDVEQNDQYKIYRNYPESPILKNNDNNSHDIFTIPHTISTLNINFTGCYHDRRPNPLK